MNIRMAPGYNGHESETTGKRNAATAAASRDWNAVLFYLKREDLNIDEEDSNKNTALHWACWYGNEAIAKELLARGARIGISNCIGEQPVHFCAKSDKLNCLKLLHDQDERVVLTQDEDGFTALHHCAQKDLIGIMEWLYLQGAPLNFQDGYGFTPLHWAVYSGNIRAAQWLLAAGAKPDVLDSDGCSILHWIAIKGKDMMLEMLLKVAPQVVSDPAMYRLKEKGQDKNVVELASHHKCLAWSLRLMQFSLEHFGRLPPDCLFQAPVLLYVFFNLTNMCLVMGVFLPAFIEEGSLTFSLFHCVVIQVTSQLFSMVNWWYTMTSDPGYMLQSRATANEAQALEDRLLDIRERITKSESPETEDLSLAKMLSDALADLRSKRQSAASPEYLKTVLEKAPACVASSTWLPKICVVCGLERHPRIKHCKECGRCVERFDHHCPWVHSCVGASNQRYFFCFLLSLTIAITMAQYLSFRYFLLPVNHYFFSALLNFGANVLWFFFLFCLSTRQFCLAAGDVTEYEVLTRPEYLEARMQDRECCWWLRDIGPMQMLANLYAHTTRDMSTNKKYDTINELSSVELSNSPFVV